MRLAHISRLSCCNANSSDPGYIAMQQSKSSRSVLTPRNEMLAGSPNVSRFHFNRRFSAVAA
jgi:hypothetical protein